MAKELGFRLKRYPIGEEMIRYRPYVTLDEMIHCLNDIDNGWLCHPVIRDKADPVRRLILHIESENYTKQYKSKEYPWYQDDPNNYAISLPIKNKFGNLELIVRSGSSLDHYWQHPNGKWNKSETFAKGVTGNPIFYEYSSGQFWTVCKLKTGGVGFWWRDNKAHKYPWYGPSIILHENADPAMVSGFQDGRHIVVCKSDNQYNYWVKDKKKWQKNAPLAE